jgi:hypothetical protein
MKRKLDYCEPRFSNQEGARVHLVQDSYFVILQKRTQRLVEEFRAKKGIIMT